MKYRKKPVIIDALQIPLKPEKGEDRKEQQWIVTMAQLAVWIDSDAVWEYAEDGGIDIETLEGVMHASPGDWIIKGVNGEYYSCKPDIFEKTYERVV